MSGPKVSGTRPTGGGADAAGVFTQAFSQVMDAIQAGEQAKLLKLQIETGARQQAATRVTNFVEGMLKAEMARNPGGAGAAIEMYAPMLAQVAELNGLDRTSSESMWRDVAAQVNANPSLKDTISKDMASWITADPPEQTAVLKQWGASKQAPQGTATQSPQGTMTSRPTETPEILESPVTPVAPDTPAASVTPGAPPPELSDEDPWIRQMQGPVTPEKSALVKERYERATAALKTQDMSNPLSVKQTTTALRQSREAMTAGSKAEDKPRLDDPKVQDKYKKTFGPNWRQILGYAALGDETLNRYLGVEAGKNINLTLNPKEQAEAELLKKRLEHWEVSGEPVETTQALALARIESEMRKDLSADASERAAATAKESTERAEMQQRYSTRRTLIADIEKLRRSYMTGGKLDENRFKRDPLYEDKLMQLAEIEAQLNPDAPPPRVIYDKLKTGWWLWQKEVEVPAGIERPSTPRPQGEPTGRSLSGSGRSPATPVTGKVDSMINQF